MKKFLFISFLFSSICAIRAQSWCHQGAEWYYTKISQSQPTYLKITYAGTVTVNSYTCQQLDCLYGTLNSSNMPVYSSTSACYYTYISNNIVYLAIDNTSTFDTLYNFDAVPGDKWLLPDNNVIGLSCVKSKLTVADTGHRVIQGVNLKWLKVTISNGSPILDTIYERFGLKQNFYLSFDVCSSSHDNWAGGPLRCYSDNQISNYKNVSFACDYLPSSTSVKENEIGDDEISFFPNPVSNKLNLTLKQTKFKSYKIVIINYLGEIVHQLNDPISTQNIDVSFLTTGIYYLKVYDDRKQKTYKMIKE